MIVVIDLATYLCILKVIVCPILIGVGIKKVTVDPMGYCYLAERDCPNENGMLSEL